MQRRRSAPRLESQYKELRARNNDSVKKSREKSRRQRHATIKSIEQLQEENQQLQQSIKGIQSEYEQLHSLFKEHTGMDFDGPTAKETEKAVLQIQTAESSVALDAKNLDGSTVLINGVRYKIVSVDSS